MDTVKKDSTVSVTLIARLDDGSVAMQATKAKPLSFKIGKKGILKSLSNKILGMSTGQERSFKLKPSEAFGDYDPNKIIYVKKRDLGKKPNISIGDQVTILQGSGRQVHGWVERYEGDQIKVNRNHKLSGQNLEISLRILEIN